MAFLGFKSIGHAIATGLTKLRDGAKDVEGLITKFEGNPQVQAAIEGVSALAFGPGSVAVEKSVFAVAGEVGSFLMEADSATLQKLLDLGFDQKIITDFKTLLTTAKEPLAAQLVGAAPAASPAVSHVEPAVPAAG